MQTCLLRRPFDSCGADGRSRSIVSCASAMERRSGCSICPPSDWFRSPRVKAARFFVYVVVHRLPCCRVRFDPGSVRCRRRKRSWRCVQKSSMRSRSWDSDESEHCKLRLHLLVVGTSSSVPSRCFLSSCGSSPPFVRLPWRISCLGGVRRTIHVPRVLCGPPPPSHPPPRRV